MKSLAISVDGLSATDWPMLCELLPSLRSNGRLTRVNSPAMLGAQAAWSEIITGETWQSAGIPGFGIPGTSINDVRSVSSQNLLAPISLFEKSQALSVGVNVPLMGQSGFWVSDHGSAASVLHESSRSGANAAFKQCAYVSIASAAVDLEQSVELLLQVELSKVRRIAEFLERNNWHLCILRLTLFDQLAHLLGHDWILMRNHVAWRQLKDAFRELEQTLARLRRVVASWSLFSLHGNERCKATVNVNRILEQEGLAVTLEAARLLDDKQIKARIAATSLLTAQPPEFITTYRLMNRFDPTKTKAASILASTVYLNLAGRFADGIVCQAELKTLRYETAQRLRCRFAALGIHVEEIGYSNPRLPDLLLTGPGIDFSSYSSTAINKVDTPRSVHSNRGFFVSDYYDCAGIEIEVRDLNGIISAIAA